MIKFFLFITLILSLSTFSQNLKVVDNTVLKYKRFETIEQLSNKIQQDFYTEKEKVRAVYTWIANNIRYDKYFITTPTTYVFTSEQDLKRQINTQIDNTAVKTFHSQKGVCYDFASLFYKICNNLNIKCEIIQGYAKNKVTATASTEISSLISNHAWNKVYINNKPYLIDATWSLTIIPNKKGYIKKINYDFFLTNPYLFILDHYPEKFKDSLVNKDISKVSFINFPKIYLDGYKGVRLIRPIKSKINRKKQSNTKFTFKILKPIKEITILLGNKFYRNIPYSYDNNILTFDLDLKNKRGNNLTLFINNKPTCSYWLE